MLHKKYNNNTIFFKEIQLNFYKENNIKFKLTPCIISKNNKKLKNKKKNQFYALKFFICEDPMLLKFINNLMRKGNKAKAEKIFFSVLANLKKNRIKGKKDINVYTLIRKAVFLLQPYMWLQKIKRFDTNVVPNVVSFTHNISKASKTLIKYAILRNQEKRIEDKISNELIETLKHKSLSFKKKVELERNVCLNRINLRWRYK